MEEMREFMEGLRERGFEGFDREQMRERMREMREKNEEKVREVLTDEQKGKYDEYLEERADRSGRFGRREGRGEGERRDRRRSRRTPERVVKEAMDALKIEDEEEAEAIKISVTKVVESQNELRSFDRKAGAEMEEILGDEDISEEYIQEKLEEFRRQRLGIQNGIRDSQKELRQVVSYRQEMILFKLGILE